MNAPLSPIQLRRSELAAVAARHATRPVPDAVIQRAEADDVMFPALAVIRGEVGIYGSAGNVLGATRYITESTAAVIVARKRAGKLGAQVSTEKRAEMKRQLDQLEEAMEVLRGQLSACDEDGHDAADVRIAAMGSRS
mgnify:CR=1 FL=1